MPSITLHTGEIGDEGLFSPASDAFTDIPGGVPGYINCFDVQDEHFLDGLAGTPLDEGSIFALEGRRVCAVVHDSDVSDLGHEHITSKDIRICTYQNVAMTTSRQFLCHTVTNSTIPHLFKVKRQKYRQ